MKNKPLLIRNETRPIERFTLNLLPKLVRHDKMEGRDFLVVPMVILTEGVHCGSEGPMLYPKDELAKTPAIWNHKPIVVYHPEMNGQGVSACSPTILTNRKVGVMMNTTFEDGRLKSEAWIEPSRANAVDERILEAIENNRMMELSTGVFVDCEKGDGEWNGEDYMGIARNYRPDHLALLPDKIGACSIKDGAGFLRNARKLDVTDLSNTERERFQKLMGGVVRKVLSGLGISNEMSFSNTAEALGNALREKFGGGDRNGPMVFVENVYSNFVIFFKDDKLFRLGYTTSDTGVTLDKEQPVEVVRVTEYRTVEGGAFVGNRQTKTAADKTNMNKVALIAAIIANAAWSKTEPAKLEALSEDQLKMIHDNLQAPAAPPAPAPAQNQTPSTTPPAPAPKTDEQEPKVITLDEYIAAAPSQLQDVLRNSVSVHNEEKQKLVEALLANKNCPFSKEDLNNRPLGELRNLAKLASVQTASKPAANYSGQGVPPPTQNAEVEEPLEMPVMNFNKAAAAK